MGYTHKHTRNINYYVYIYNLYASIIMIFIDIVEMREAQSDYKVNEKKNVMTITMMMMVMMRF